MQEKKGLKQDLRRRSDILPENPTLDIAESKKFLMAPSLAAGAGASGIEKRHSSRWEWETIRTLDKISLRYETADTLLLRKVIVNSYWLRVKG